VAIDNAKAKAAAAQGLPGGDDYNDDGIGEDYRMVGGANQQVNLPITALGQSMGKIPTAVEAIKDYEARDENELELKVGDYIMLMDKDEEPYLSDVGWLCGAVGNQKGYFPANVTGPVHNYGTTEDNQQPFTSSFENVRKPVKIASYGDVGGAERQPPLRQESAMQAFPGGGGDPAPAPMANQQPGALWDHLPAEMRNAIGSGQLEGDDLESVFFDGNLDEFEEAEPDDAEIAVHNKLDPEEEVIWRFLLMNRRTKMHLHADLEVHDSTFQGQWDFARHTAYGIVHDWRFEVFFLLIIAANVITLSLYKPLEDADFGRNFYLQYVEFAFLGLYWVELILKATADGFIQKKNTTVKSYTSDPSNILDLIIVLSGTLELVFFVTGTGSGAGVTALRAFRALRAVKFIKQFENLRLVINVIFKALPPLGSVAVVALVILIIYVVLGMQLYGGVLRRACYFDDNITQVETRACGTAATAHHCLANQTCYSWADVPLGFASPVPPFEGVWSFDNAGLAFYTIFAIMTLEGWTDVMYALNDALGASANWIFFVSLVLIAGLFLVSMVVGVLAGLYVKESMAFKRVKAKEKERAIKRGEWKEPVKRVAPEPIMAHLEPYINGKMFNGFILLVIIANAVYLAIDHAHQSQDFADQLAFANYIFVAVFVFELLAKCFILGPSLYLFDGFNKFDAIITVLSVLELVLTEAVDIGDDFMIRVFRSLRLFRVLRVASNSDKMKELGQGVVNAVNGLGAVVALIFLYLIVVSLIGMQLFGGNENWPSDRITYDTFGESMITSFIIQTGEGWNDVLKYAVVAWGGAQSTGVFAGIIFVFMMMFGHFVLFGVLLAIAYENLNAMAPKLEGADLDPDAIANKAYLTVEDKSMVESPATLLMISTKNAFRVWCHDTMWHTWFDPFILVCIFVSSILLGAADHANPENNRNDTLFYFDLLFTIIFTCEMLIKMVATGIVWHKRAYLRSSWNVLDFIIVAASLTATILHFTLPDVNIGAVRIIRTLRLLRPLRAVKRSPGMKKVVGAMMDSVIQIGALLGAALLILFCFSVMGTSFYKEQMNYCSDADAVNKSMCEGNFTYAIDPISKDRYSFNELDAFYNESNNTVNLNFYHEEREWLLPYLNFDYSYKSAEALFSIFGFEDWVKLYFQAADTVGVDQQPVVNNRPFHIFFFMLYLLIVALFFINIVMAFVVLTYQNQADELKATTGLSKTQVSALQYALSVKQPHDKFRHRRKKRFVPDHKGNEWMVDVHGIPVRGRYVVEKNLLWFIDHKYFEGAMLLLVLLNVVSLLISYYDMSLAYENALDLSNYIFVGLFVLEAIVKILVLGSKAYFTDYWNLFDFIVVAGSLIDITVADYIQITFLRVFRVARLAKFFKSGSLRAIFDTCIKSMGSVPYVLLVMLLFYYIYAVVGMLLFARIPLGINPGINEHNHFQDLPNALMVLFRTMTGEAWQTILAATYISDGEELGVCVNNPGEDEGIVSCGSSVNVFYFLSFVLVTTLLVINVLIAVIVDNFEYLYVDKSELQVHHLQDFVAEWCKLDPAGTGKIHHTWLIPLLKGIEPPLGLGKKCPSFMAHRMLARAPIPLDENGFIGFRASLVGLIRCKMDMWLFDFPNIDDLHSIMKHIAPGASDEAIRDGAPVDEGIQLRFLYTVQRLQHIFRLNRRAAHVRDRVARLEKNMMHAQLGYEQRVSLIASPLDHHRQTAESAMLAKYKAGVAQRVSALKTAIKPGAVLAFELTKGHLEQRHRAIASKGKRDSLKAQWLALTGKVKRSTPTKEQMLRYNDIHPHTTRPLRSTKKKGWQPKKRGSMLSTEQQGGAGGRQISSSMLHPSIAARMPGFQQNQAPPRALSGSNMYRDPVPVSLAGQQSQDYRAFAMQPGAPQSSMMAGVSSNPVPPHAVGPAAAQAYLQLAKGNYIKAAGLTGPPAAQAFRGAGNQAAMQNKAMQNATRGNGLQALLHTGNPGAGSGMGSSPGAGNGPVPQSTRMFRQDPWQMQMQQQQQMHQMQPQQMQQRTQQFGVNGASPPSSPQQQRMQMQMQQQRLQQPRF
jgi:hypothetical protein